MAETAARQRMVLSESKVLRLFSFFRKRSAKFREYPQGVCPGEHTSIVNGLKVGNRPVRGIFQ